MKAKWTVVKLGILVLAMVLVTGLAYAASVQQQLVQDSTLEQVLKRGVLRVGFSTFVPWAMASADTLPLDRESIVNDKCSMINFVV